MKLLRFFGYAVVAWCVAVLLYGFINFIDAPYKPCSPGPYCGKTKKPHTREEYEAFRRWEATLFISWPFGLAVAFTLKPPWSQTQRNKKLPD